MNGAQAGSIFETFVISKITNNFLVLGKMKNKSIGNKTIICTCDGINKLSDDTYAVNYAYI